MIIISYNCMHRDLLEIQILVLCVVFDFKWKTYLVGLP